MLEAGTLVWVRDEALSNASFFAVGNRQAVAEDGRMYIVRGKEHPDGSVYNCDSIATGVIRKWFDYELEPYKEQTDDT